MRLWAYLESWHQLASDIPSKSPLSLYVSCDHVDTPRLLTDRFGRVVKKLRHDSFGVPLEDSYPDLFLPIGFAGGLVDADTGLVRFGWRDYDPKVGRFTAPDPANDRRGDGDVYDYCVDDPVSRKDATGLAWWFAVPPAIAAANTARAAWLTRGPAAVKNAKDFFSSLAMPPSASANSAEVAGTVTSRYGDDVWDFVKRLPQRQRDIRKRWEESDYADDLDD